MGDANIQEINPRACGIVSAFAEEILSSLKDQVISISATGSCITGDYVHGLSDINTVLVLRDMDPSFLDCLSLLGKRYGKKRLRAPLIMTPEYIERSLDVFPIELLDIKLIHKTVHGPDLFSDLSINKSLLRLQCERDLKAKLIQLHQGYISCMGTGKGLRALLLGALPTFFPLFRAMLSMVQISRAPAIRKDDVLADMGSSFGVSTDIFRDIRALGMKKGFFVDAGMTKDLFNRLYRITHDLSLSMDRLSH